MPKTDWALHGIPVYIDLDYERGRVFGTIHLDIPQEGLPEVCYAAFLDPSNAIIVRSVNFDSSTQPKPKQIFCTTDLDPQWRKAPGDHTIVWLSDGVAVQVDRDNFRKVVELQQEPASLVHDVNHVVRLGIGSFVKTEHGFKEQPKKMQKSQLGRSDPPNDSGCMISGFMEIDGKEVQVEFEAGSLMSVSHEDSWGVITRDDARVPISIR